MVRSCCKSCSIPNGKLLPNLSSSLLFLSAFHFHQPRKFPGWNLSLKKFCRGKPRQRGDWTGVKCSSQSRKANFLTLPDLAFGFVHKRSGNEIAKLIEFYVEYKIQTGHWSQRRIWPKLNKIGIILTKLPYISVCNTNLPQRLSGKKIGEKKTVTIKNLNKTT